MAQEYVIRIKDETSQTSEAPVASQKPQGEQQGQPKQKNEKSIASYVASKAIQPMARAITSHITSTVGIEYGSNELQQKTDFAMSLVDTSISTWSTVSSTAAAFGSAGIGIGLVVAATSMLTQIGVKMAQLDQKMAVENQDLALYRSRFGMAFNGSRTGGAT